ncbi:MAG: Jag N-terminal domain-containing protein, partial [Candidatus Omnitrophota bacterium]|nr:Jag N-terminal domain-containing protein [Candidatus Omnitrophota bacterium]
ISDVQKSTGYRMRKKVSKSIEVEGGDVEEAIEKAIKLLNVTRDDIIVKIVCEEKKGLFGMEGAKPAKIKVSIKEKQQFP